jgi:beta-mannosidase
LPAQARAALAAGAHAYLKFEGVDPSAAVYLDGHWVGDLAGPFGTQTLDVTSALAGAGRVDLAVVLPPVPANEPQVGFTDRVRRLAPRLNYGWDFSPPLPHQGIWRAVTLAVGDTVADDIAVGCSYDPDRDVAVVEVSGRVLCAREGDWPLIVQVDIPARSVRVQVPGPASGSSPTTGAGQGLDSSFEVEVEVADPPVWEPWGLGPQDLIDVTLTTCDGTVLAHRRTGARTAEWERNPMSPADSLPYTLRVNGRKIEPVGWNWAPADTLYGTITPDRLRHLLTLARASGARILRVWGGGLLETPDFYGLADELGLLVWQEFPQSSSGHQSAPADDPDFAAYLAHQARAAIRERRHHPSLVLWDGGNELQTDKPLATADSPALQALAEAVATHDPGRAWLPTSPSGPVFAYKPDPAHPVRPQDRHDVHGPWEHQGLTEHAALYNSTAALAHTEFGVEGLCGQRQMDALIAPEHRWPPTRENPVFRHLGDWWVNTPLVDAAFGGRILANPDWALLNLRRASQFLQATGLKYAVEADRRRAPYCSLVLPWQLAESYPNAFCTSAVDYAGDAKPALWAVAQAFEPTRVTIAVPQDAWPGAAWAGATAHVWGAADGAVRLALLGLDGQEITAADGPSLQVRRARLPDLFFWAATWQTGDSVYDDYRLGGRDDWGPLLDPAHAVRDDEAEIKAEDFQIRIENHGSTAIVGLHVTDARPLGSPGGLIAPCCPQPLFPQAGRTITLSWTGAPGPVSIDWVNHPTPPIIVSKGLT